MNVSESSYRKLLTNHPNLCFDGFGVPNASGFPPERRRLEDSFQEFALCCDWLLDCIPLKHVSFVSPVTADLLPLIEKHTGTPVSNGALIAAVLHMRIPCQPLPDSNNARIGISRRSPALGEGGRG